MSDMRPNLLPGLHADDFGSFYWLKKELLQFCRTYGIAASGSKQDLEARIKVFLNTGDVNKASKARPSIAKLPAQPLVLKLDAPVPIGFRCSYEARDFFIQYLGPSFRYSVALQKYVRENPGITFFQVIEEYKRQQDAKALHTSRIDSQFEYNQFTRDYFLDPANQGKSRQDCIEAWHRIKAQRGPRTYRPS